MALLIPEFLGTKTYEAKRVRRAVRASGVIQEGIVERGHFAVTQRGAGANMSVDVAAGEAWIKGDSAVDQGYYHITNDATVNAAITANASGKPRIDLVYVQIGDSADIGGSDTPALGVAVGTPETGTTLATLAGAAALPINALPLAYVLVATGATEIKNASIGYLRDPKNYFAELGQTKATPYAVEGAPPPYAHGRPLAWVPAVQALRTAEYASANPMIIPLASSETYDTEEMHDLVTNATRLIAKTPGLYAVTAHHVSVAINPTVIAYIRVNGGGTAYGRTYLVNSASASASAQVRLGYGDYVEYVVENSEAKNASSAVSSMVWQGP